MAETLDEYEQTIKEIAASDLTRNGICAALDMVADELYQALWKPSFKIRAIQLAKSAMVEVGRLTREAELEGEMIDFLKGMDELAARGKLRRKAEQ